MTRRRGGQLSSGARRRAASLTEVLLAVGVIALVAACLVAIGSRVLARRARDVSRALDGHGVPPSSGASSATDLPATAGAGPAPSASGAGADPPDDGEWSDSVLLGDDDDDAGFEGDQPSEGNLAPKEVVRRTKEMQEDLFGGLPVRRRRSSEKEEKKKEEATKYRTKVEEYRKRAQAARGLEGPKDERAAAELDAAADLWERKARKAEEEARRAGEQARNLETEEKERAEARSRRAELGGSAGAPTQPPDPAARRRQEQVAETHRKKAADWRKKLEQGKEGWAKNREVKLAAEDKMQEAQAEYEALDKEFQEATAANDQAKLKEVSPRRGAAAVDRNRLSDRMWEARVNFRDSERRVAAAEAELRAAEAAAGKAEREAGSPEPGNAGPIADADRERLRNALAADELEAVLRARARVLREEPIDVVRTFGEGSVNPGQHERIDDRWNTLTLAPYLLAVNDSPWVPTWAPEQWDFQQRILMHELAHSLHTNPKNKRNIERFLELRFRQNIKRFRALNLAWKKARTAWRARLEETKEAKELPKSAQPDWKELSRRKQEIDQLPGDERAREQALLDRDVEIAAARLAGNEIEQRAREEGIALPARFTGDAHAFANEKEYFAVAVELYFHDPRRFQESYTQAERETIEQMFDGRRNEFDQPDDLEARTK